MGPGAKPPGKFLDPANGRGKMLNFKCETLTKNGRWNLLKNKYRISGICYILYANPDVIPKLSDITIEKN